MAPTAMFSDLLADLAGAHAHEIQSVRDELGATVDSMAAEIQSLRGQLSKPLSPLSEASQPSPQADSPASPASQTIIAQTDSLTVSEIPAFKAGTDGSREPPPGKPRPTFDYAPAEDNGPAHVLAITNDQHDERKSSTRRHCERRGGSLSKSSAKGSQHFLRSHWNRQAIWDADEVTLPKERKINRTRTVIGLGADSARDGCLRFMGCNSKCVIFPHSAFRSFWDVASLILIILDLLTLPFLFAFDPNPFLALTVLEWISLLFWTADMVQGPFLGYFDLGEYVDARWRVLKHYLRTWFAVDMLAIGPEWAIIILGGVATSMHNMAGLGKMFKTVRVIRVLRLLRLAKVKRLIQAVYDMSKNEFSFVVINLTQLLTIILLLNHLTACAWYAVGNAMFRKGDVSWIGNVIANEGQITMANYYLASLHWSLTQFTPASIQISACNEWERLFSIVVLFFAMVVFSSFVGSITNHITRLRSLRNDTTKQLWLLRRFLREHEVSEHLSQRVQKFIEHKLSQEAGQLKLTELDILDKLSVALSDELKYDLHSKYVCVHPFFQCLSCEIEVIMHRICQSVLKSLNCAAGELIFSPGDEGKNMFMVRAGELEYNRVGLKPVFLVGDLQIELAMRWIAEAVLWTPWRHRGKLMNGRLAPSELIVLSPELFFEVLSKQPRSWLYATVYGEHFVQHLNDIKQLSDVVAQRDFSYNEFVKDAMQVASSPWNKDRTTRRLSGSTDADERDQEVEVDFDSEFPERSTASLEAFSMTSKAEEPDPSLIKATL